MKRLEKIMIVGMIVRKMMSKSTVTTNIKNKNKNQEHYKNTNTHKGKEILQM